MVVLEICGRSRVRSDATLALLICLALVLPGRGVRAQPAVETDGRFGAPMFPTPFSRVVESRFLVNGELDHRWHVRETYWDHFLILENEAPGREVGAGDGSAGSDGQDATATPNSGRRRIIDLRTGDIVEIDWGAGTFWRSSQRRQRELLRRLERAEGLGLAEASPADGTGTGRTRDAQANRYEVDPLASPEAPRAVAGLRADSRFFRSDDSRSLGPSASRNRGKEAVRFSARAFVGGSGGGGASEPVDASRADSSSGSGGTPGRGTRPAVLQAVVWFDDRIVLSAAALQALEEVAAHGDPTTSLITVSPLAAEARVSTSGALLLAAEATVRLPGPAGVRRLAELSESTIRLELAVNGASLLRIPPGMLEVVAPLEAVVERAELERRLDEGRQP